MRRAVSDNGSSSVTLPARCGAVSQPGTRNQTECFSVNRSESVAGCPQEEKRSCSAARWSHGDHLCLWLNYVSEDESSFNPKEEEMNSEFSVCLCHSPEL